MRIYKSTLEGALKGLNADKPNASFSIRNQNGAWALFRKNKRGRDQLITGWCSKKELFYIIDAIRTVTLEEMLEEVKFS